MLKQTGATKYNATQIPNIELQVQPMYVRSLVNYCMVYKYV